MTHRAVCLLLLGLLSCQDDVAVLEIDLADLPADTARIEVRVALPTDGAPRAARELAATRGFDVRLPREARDTVHLRLGGLSDKGCLSGQVEADVPIAGPGRYPLRLQMSPRAGCTLRITRVGEGQGQVSARPAGLSCQDWSRPCTARYPGRERRVQLVASAAEQDSYFLGWTGACHGTGVCDLDVDRDESLVGAMLLPRTLCAASGWCWQNPRPTGESLLGLWGSSATDLWAVGDNGLILRGDGRVFAPLPRQTTAPLLSIHGSGPNDAWAVGAGGAVLRWRGVGGRSRTWAPRRA